MLSREKRSNCRQAVEMPVLVAPDPWHPYLQARACNACSGGMYLESPFHRPPQSALYIRVDGMNGEGGCDAPVAYVGTVRWHRALYAGEFRSGLGVQYMLRGQLYRECAAWRRCDICGACASAEMHVTDAQICLCSTCFHRMGSLECGSIRCGIERFLEGNVV